MTQLPGETETQLTGPLRVVVDDAGAVISGSAQAELAIARGLPIQAMNLGGAAARMLVSSREIMTLRKCTRQNIKWHMSKGFTALREADANDTPRAALVGKYLVPLESRGRYNVYDWNEVLAWHRQNPPRPTAGTTRKRKGKGKTVTKRATRATRAASPRKTQKKKVKK